MTPEYETIYELIVRSFTSKLNDADMLTLNQWKAEDERNKLEYLDMKQIWTVSGKMFLPHPVDIRNYLNITRRRAGIKGGKAVLLKYMTQVAAIVVISLILNILYQYFGKSPAPVQREETVFQQVRAAYGTQSSVVLADGTIVVLNSGSTLSFPVSFREQSDRKVRLAGEGHFKVAKNIQQPFIVEVNSLEIKVLGTIFNVDSYANNPNITVALVEGSVTLQSNTDHGLVEMAKMKPNEVAIFQQAGNIVSISSVPDINKFTAWKDGKIVFSDDPIQTVIRKLSNWYNVDIVLEDKRLEKYRFTGTFIDEPIEQILSILNLTSKMHYSIIPAKKLADNSYSKRKIILKLK